MADLVTLGGMIANRITQQEYDDGMRKPVDYSTEFMFDLKEPTADPNDAPFPKVGSGMGTYITNCQKKDSHDCDLEMQVNINFLGVRSRDPEPLHVFIDIANSVHSERIQCGLREEDECT